MNSKLFDGLKLYEIIIESSALWYSVINVKIIMENLINLFLNVNTSISFTDLIQCFISESIQYY